MARKSQDKGCLNIEQSRTTVSALQQDSNLWYRVRVLLYDLQNIASDPNAERRISSATHELYISEPYFTDAEATKIVTALISLNSPDSSIPLKEVTVEEAIHSTMSNFLEKRKASGDSRPCGPHDMVPVYGSVLGVAKEELKDERFLSRLRRSGVRREPEPHAEAMSKDKGKIRPEKQKKGGRVV